MHVKKLTVLALFTTLSLAVYAVESAIPPLVPIPGIKLGLANIITLILLQNASAKDALMVLAARILLSSLLFGNVLSLLYSLCGGGLSLLALMVTSTPGITAYFPFLILSGILTGLFTGLCGQFAGRYLLRGRHLFR